MSFDFASLKAQARQAVHETLGVPALYQDATTSEPQPITARWHNQIVKEGDLQNQGYAMVLAGIDRIVLSAADASRLGVKRNGTITFPAYDNITFNLDARLPSDGPFEQVWEVSRA